MKKSLAVPLLLVLLFIGGKHALAKTINLPTVAIEVAIEKANQYVREKKIDINDAFIGIVEYHNLHNEYEHPYWRVRTLERMHRALLLVWMVWPALAFAEAFDDRFKLAKDAETSETYKPYQRVMYQSIGNHLANTMRSCFGKTEKPETNAFVLLADVDAGGTARAIDVRPKTSIAICFAQGVATAPFPTPPAFPGRDAFPIVIEMKITP